MRCRECGNVSDWMGPESDWTPVSGETVAVRPVYECDNCGNTQLIR